MKNYASVIVFIIILSSSALSSIGSYRATEQNVVDNLNQALHQAINKNKSTWLGQDTITNYRLMQRIMAAPLAINMRDETLSRCMGENLRNDTFIQMQLVDAESHEQMQASNYLCSDTILLTNHQQHTSIALRSVAQCSKATIFAMSDQRLSLALCFLSLIWAVAFFRKGRDKAEMAVVCQQPDSSCRMIGGITLRDDAFFDSEQQEIHLTPMQRRLLNMFFDAPDHKLRQSDICNSLWPKKDDASETLYALMTRTKKAIESRCGIKIEVDRGRGYSLTVNQ